MFRLERGASSPKRYSIGGDRKMQRPGRAAIVRHEGRVTTIGEMSAAEILSALSDGQKAEMAGSLGLALPAKASAVRSTPDGTPAAERARMKTVMSSDKVKGRESAALAMLADDEFAGVSAQGIISMLERIPVGSADDSREGRAIFEAMIAGNDPLTRSMKAAEAAAESNHGWDAIHAEIAERRGLRLEEVAHHG